MKLSDRLKWFSPNYRINVSLDGLESLIERYKANYDLDLNPDFQRGHIWTLDQQIAFCEYLFSGGLSGRDIYFNHPTWGASYKGRMLIVDGKQRLNALLLMLQDAFPIFGEPLSSHEGYQIALKRTDIIVHINSLKQREDVLKWYLAFNSGGTVHSKEELSRVRRLLEKESGGE